ncbi:MAG: hypothetical protein K8S94_13635 [Planctomycetia bacterium]|nr:hypothetical protein [Planctomycetia bacterium]
MQSIVGGLHARKGFQARRMFVHLGLAKTGTTFLQHSLFESRAHLLANHGVLYPAGGPNHWHFQSTVSIAPENLIQIRRAAISSPEKARALVEAFLADFNEEVSATMPDTIVVSSEYFAGMTPDELARLAVLFSDYAEEIIGVVYVRDPWSLSISMMQQLIRDGAIAAPFSFGYDNGHVQVLKRFERIFGDKLIVRPYLGGSLQRTDILADFCRATGIPLLREGTTRPANANLSIGRVRSILIAEFNRHWPQYDEQGLYRHSVDRDHALQALLDLPLTDTPIVHARQQAEIIRTCARNDMDYVEQRYFGGAPIFTDYVNEETYPVFDYATRLESLTDTELREVIRATLVAAGKDKAIPLL